MAKIAYTCKVGPWGSTHKSDRHKDLKALASVLWIYSKKEPGWAQLIKENSNVK